MMQEIKITANRVGVLIGKGGATKQELEEKTKTTISIDSTEGLVRVEGEDAVGALRAVEVVTAINRGFSPERAFTLLEDEDLLLDVIDLSGMADNPRQLRPDQGKDHRKRREVEGTDRAHDRYHDLCLWKNRCAYRPPRTDQGCTRSRGDDPEGCASRSGVFVPGTKKERSKARDAGLLLLNRKGSPLHSSISSGQKTGSDPPVKLTHEDMRVLEWK